MGCDIHFVIEAEYFNYGWIGVYNTSDSPRAVDELYNMHNRDYAFFAALAGVRGDGPEPKGMPDNASIMAQEENDSWRSDGHSWSYCSWEHFVRTYLQTAYRVQTTAAKLKGDEDPFEVFHKAIFPYQDPDKFRVVFFFDN